jgi:hypothetical protein
MSQTIEEVMGRLKSLKEFTVEREMPDEFMFRGVIPFDIKISGTVGIFKIIAASQEEADSKVDEFISQHQ